MKYKNYMLEVDAIEFTGDNFDEISDTFGHVDYMYFNLADPVHITIANLGSIAVGKPGDYVVKGFGSLISIFKRDIFLECFEMV